jgi:hypothetical protein
MLLFLSARKINASSLGLSSTSKITLVSISMLLETRDCEIESAPLVQLCIGPNTASVPMNDALNASSGVNWSSDFRHQLPEFDEQSVVLSLGGDFLGRIDLGR